MDIQGAHTELLKIKANLAKDPATSADRNKSELVRKLDGILNALKPVIEKQKKIKATLAGIANVNTEIVAFNTAMTKIAGDARAAHKDAAGHSKSDTPKRDYFMMANYLQIVGQQESFDKI